MSLLDDLIPVKLGPVTALAGTVGIDAMGTIIVEAGVNVDGEEYVSVIAKASELTPKSRRKMADRMISIWDKFGGKP